MFTDSAHIERRTLLRKRLRSGSALLLGNVDTPINFPHNVHVFRQDSTFLYFFRVNRPGIAAIIDIDSGAETAFGDKGSAIVSAFKVADDDTVTSNHPRVTAGVDFASRMRERPGAYMLIGNGRRNADGGGNFHSPRYDFNDKAPPLGIAYWSSIVNKELDGRMGAA
jgi:Aminopeptidase P, N-terminal domain